MAVIQTGRVGLSGTSFIADRTRPTADKVLRSHAVQTCLWSILYTQRTWSISSDTPAHMYRAANSHLSLLVRPCHLSCSMIGEYQGTAALMIPSESLQLWAEHLYHVSPAGSNSRNPELSDKLGPWSKFCHVCHLAPISPGRGSPLAWSFPRFLSVSLVKKFNWEFFLARLRGGVHITKAIHDFTVLITKHPGFRSHLDRAFLLLLWVSSRCSGSPTIKLLLSLNKKQRYWHLKKKDNEKCLSSTNSHTFKHVYLSNQWLLLNKIVNVSMIKYRHKAKIIHSGWIFTQLLTCFSGRTHF